MRSMMIDTREFRSARFGRLCSALDVDAPGDRWRTFGHLVAWYLTWGGEVETETGVWFGLSAQAIGAWADVGGTAEAAAWGRALHRAGYMRTLKELYPEPLGGKRPGWVAVAQDGSAAIDGNAGYFRRRDQFGELVLYITDRVKRAQWAAVAGVDAGRLEAEGLIPAGWLAGGGSGADRAPLREMAGEFSRQGAEAHSLGAPERRLGQMAAVSMEPPAAGPAPAVAPRRVVRGFAGSDGGSASPKSLDMLAEIRGCKYSDPFRALCMLDASERAQHCWRQAISRNINRVRDEIGQLVETDERWAVVRNPAAVLMANFVRRGLVAGRGG